MELVQARPVVVRSAQDFLVRVYSWMATGLIVTGAVAWYTSQDLAMLETILPLMWPLLGLELLLVFALSGWASRLSPAAAGGVFLAYSALNGLTLSPIFLVYTHSSIARVFFITAGTFGGMSLYGLTTRSNLSSVGSFCFMGLIGLVLAGFINLWIGSDKMDWILSIVGVIVFVGLTAWDNQKLAEMAQSIDADSREGRTSAIVGALSLYLDFINLFLSLLRLMGDRD